MSLARFVTRLFRRRKPAVASPDAPTFEAALHRLGGRNISVNSVIDVGASNGCWSQALLPVYPQARYLCVEAQPVHEPALRAFVARHANAEFVLAAAGEEEGRIYFDASDPFGGIASSTPLGRGGITVPVVTIDAQVASRNLRPPYLIKLDTHGFEMPILAGAEQTLKQANVLVIEAYNFDIAPSAVRFAELCARLEARGFRCVDLFDVMYRPTDNALWQMDLIFIRSDRAEFGTNRYG
jgi:FkbM family methyltransferase